VHHKYCKDGFHCIKIVFEKERKNNNVQRSSTDTYNDCKAIFYYILTTGFLEYVFVLYNNKKEEEERENDLSSPKNLRYFIVRQYSVVIGKNRIYYYYCTMYIWFELRSQDESRTLWFEGWRSDWAGWYITQQQQQKQKQLFYIGISI